ncbi:hypothetical protein PROFUN_12694 [Planoprotostelium fungivorum]|uniref:Uncharacterized protein n=1 Tax=Planoprotostelium fungivorum TaxID=1890364 RepID=A0A2P6N6W8_9EUKA|nr:hypothetical protein PROFUN_12694 [Planoprotostelium fungivorum]
MNEARVRPTPLDLWVFDWLHDNGHLELELVERNFAIIQKLGEMIPPMLRSVNLSDSRVEHSGHQADRGCRQTNRLNKSPGVVLGYIKIAADVVVQDTVLELMARAIRPSSVREHVNLWTSSGPSGYANQPVCGGLRIHTTFINFTRSNTAAHCHPVQIMRNSFTPQNVLLGDLRVDPSAENNEFLGS